MDNDFCQNWKVFLPIGGPETCQLSAPILHTGSHIAGRGEGEIIEHNLLQLCGERTSTLVCETTSTVDSKARSLV